MGGPEQVGHPVNDVIWYTVSFQCGARVCKWFINNPFFISIIERVKVLWPDPGQRHKE